MRMRMRMVTKPASFSAPYSNHTKWRSKGSLQTETCQAAEGYRSVHCNICSQSLPTGNCSPVSFIPSLIWSVNQIFQEFDTAPWVAERQMPANASNFLYLLSKNNGL